MGSKSKKDVAEAMVARLRVRVRVWRWKLCFCSRGGGDASNSRLVFRVSLPLATLILAIRLYKLLAQNRRVGIDEK